ncbi:hypothetical protein IW148_001859 [Coemansia sp. RSA 1199]|nr:hypothetical protein IW148_001859 [Coemansia sp. RSA 1199]
MNAQQLPDECVLRVLDYLWKEPRLHEFFERRSQHAHVYDQQRVHKVLWARSVAPMHVCRAWRQPSARRYFRTLVVDLRCQNAPLPDAAVLARHVLVLANSVQYDSLALSVKFLEAHTLGLCVFDSRDACPGVSHALASTLHSALPHLNSIWFQCMGSIGRFAQTVLEDLSARSSACVTAMHFESTESRSCVANVIRSHAHSLQFLSLGKVSGGVLSTLVVHKGKQLVYARLKRLLFAIPSNTHIYADVPEYTTSSFPQLEELYYDDAHSAGLPREEWFAPLFDVFLSHPTRLKYLTFPIVYNTQRCVSRDNCPELVGLRHIKCCWATGAWSSQQRESDSTRVLSAIASIPSLECYVHPSYIARLSRVPSDIMCTGLWRLDLYGWPLTVNNMCWVLRAFGRLQTLRVTLVQSEDVDDAWQPTSSVLKRLTVGSADAGLENQELGRLACMLELMPLLSRVSLYDQAYAFVSKAAATWTRDTRDLQITNNVSGLRSGQSFRSPLAQLTTAASANSPPSTSWYLIHPLLIDG